MAKTLNTTTAPTGQIAPFGLRMLPELKEKIEESAKAAGRSMNAEIISRLTRSLDDTLDANTQAAMLSEIYFLLDKQQQDLLKLHKQSMDELVQAVNTPHGERKHFKSTLPEPANPSTAAGIARLRPAVADNVRTTHPFLERDVLSKPPQRAVPLVGAIGGDEVKAPEAKTIAQRMEEASKKPKRPPVQRR